MSRSDGVSSEARFSSAQDSEGSAQRDIENMMMRMSTEEGLRSAYGSGMSLDGAPRQESTEHTHGRGMSDIDIEGALDHGQDPRVQQMFSELSTTIHSFVRTKVQKIEWDTSSPASAAGEASDAQGAIVDENIRSVTGSGLADDPGLIRFENRGDDPYGYVEGASAMVDRGGAGAFGAEVADTRLFESTPSSSAAGGAAHIERDAHRYVPGASSVHDVPPMHLSEDVGNYLHDDVDGAAPLPHARVGTFVHDRSIDGVPPAVGMPLSGEASRVRYGVHNSTEAVVSDPELAKVDDDNGLPGKGPGVGFGTANVLVSGHEMAPALSERGSDSALRSNSPRSAFVPVRSTSHSDAQPGSETPSGESSSQRQAAAPGSMPARRGFHQRMQVAVHASWQGPGGKRYPGTPTQGPGDAVLFADSPTAGLRGQHVHGHPVGGYESPVQNMIISPHTPYGGMPYGMCDSPHQMQESPAGAPGRVRMEYDSPQSHEGAGATYAGTYMPMHGHPDRAAGGPMHNALYAGSPSGSHGAAHPLDEAGVVPPMQRVVYAAPAAGGVMRVRRSSSEPDLGIAGGGSGQRQSAKSMFYTPVPERAYDATHATPESSSEPFRGTMHNLRVHPPPAGSGSRDSLASATSEETAASSAKAQKTKPWSTEEDEKIRKAVQEVGLKAWRMIAELLPGRTSKQCRERWHNQLDPKIRHGRWSEEEDLTLICLHKRIGNSWVDMAKVIAGRSDNQIKNRWNSAALKKFIDKTPQATVDEHMSKVLEMMSQAGIRRGRGRRSSVNSGSSRSRSRSRSASASPGRRQSTEKRSSSRSRSPARRGRATSRNSLSPGNADRSSRSRSRSPRKRTSRDLEEEEAEANAGTLVVPGESSDAGSRQRKSSSSPGQRRPSSVQAASPSGEGGGASAGSARGALRVEVNGSPPPNPPA